MSFLHSTLAAAAMLALSATAQATEVQAVSIQADTMVEFGFFTIQAGREQELGERYFSKVMPIAAEYGMRPLAMLSIGQTEYGDDLSQTLGLWEWPSLEAKESFEQDRRYKRLAPIRDSMLDNLQLIYTRPTVDVALSLQDDRLYEFAGMWISDTHAEHLGQYFASAGPFLGQNDVQFIGNFEVLGGSDPSLVPDQIAFFSWPDAQVKEAWFTSETFQESGWHRALALERLFVVEATASAPGS